MYVKVTEVEKCGHDTPVLVLLEDKSRREEQMRHANELEMLGNSQSRGTGYPRARNGLYRGDIHDRLAFTSTRGYGYQHAPIAPSAAAQDTSWTAEKRLH